MAPKLLKHEYLLSPMLWSDFEHFRISGSIIYRELFLSLTRCFRGTSSFEFSDIAAFHILRGLLLICSGVLPSVSAPIVSRRRSKSKKIKYFHGLFTTYINILNNKNQLKNRQHIQSNLNF